MVCGAGETAIRRDRLDGRVVPCGAQLDACSADRLNKFLVSESSCCNEFYNDKAERYTFFETSTHGLVRFAEDDTEEIEQGV